MLPATYQDRFLELLAETGNVSEACRRLGISRVTPYEWRDTRPGFAKLWDTALDLAREGLRQKVIETACAMGLARMLPLTDPDTGDAIVDDNFCQVMVPDITHVDARVLMKLMDKTMRDEPRQSDQVGNFININEAPVEMVVIMPDGTEYAGDEAIDAEFEVVSDE